MKKQISPSVKDVADGISRREAIKKCAVTTAGLLITEKIVSAAAADANAPQQQPIKAKAKAVIQIWMWGGPSHLDTFDPKPEAGNDYAGPLKPIPTNVDGIQICELLPLLAKQADMYSIIRGMTHGNDGHETAAYIVQTGRTPGADVYPSVGAVVSFFKGYSAGYKGLIPPYIVLTTPQGRFSEAGFLGSKYKPFATGGDPARTPFVVEGVVAEGVTEQRQKNRRDLLHKLNTLDQLVVDDPELNLMHEAEKQAYDLILGDAGKVFDLTQEKDEVRDAYGRTTFGQSCLVTRRLIERGVPYVTINYPGWDMHKEIFQAMRRKLPEMDKGMSTLLKELKERGLLDSTIVWWTGEFGRTPKIDYEPPWNGGRGHYGRAFSSVVAGGGFKGGKVVGATDEKGEKVKERPVHPSDLIASMYELLGIDTNATLPHPQGKTVKVIPSTEDGIKMYGKLTEIM